MNEKEFFQNINKKHILNAIQEIDEKGIEKGAHSSTYDVVYNGNRYPPKLVVSLANKYANGTILLRDTFSGGKDTLCFRTLERNGFEIVLKKELMGKENLKKQFIKWLIDNPRVNYYNNDPNKLESELNRYNDFFDIDIFDGKNIKEIKSFLNKELYEKTTSPFLEFSEKTSRHLPRAVLGKKNYFEYLDEKFNGGMATSKSIYSWVKTHNQLSEYLLDKEGQQPELIEILKSAGATLFNDEDPAGSKIELTEIDPFTFFCYIYKYGPETRLKILQNIAKSLNLFVPNDESGIPSTNAQKVWLFTYKYNRLNNEIKRLWIFFYAAINKTITEELFSDILKIKGVAKIKLTEALFYVDPENYFPINGPTKPYLEEVFKIDPNFSTFSEYENILNQIKTKTDKPFYQISYEAWFWNDEISSEEREFKNRIKKSNPESLQIFFQFIDKFIADLKIEDSEKLVFSTGSNQLSFQIGKRYCLNLKKDKFFFIAPKDYEINNVDKGIFAEPDAASWFKKATNNQVIKHYDAIRKAIQFEIQRDNHANEKEYDNKVFRRAVFDKDYRTKFFEFDNTKPETVDKENKVLNGILFGPPGTGKTYNTINEALKIVDLEYYKLNIKDRKALNFRFKELLIKNWEKTTGQVAFCTFHQSFSYEDFVEGIKPKINDNKEVFYEIDDGVFKKICQLADSSISAVKMKKEGKLSWDEETFNRASFYKLSLGNSQKSEDKAIYDYCVENNVIALGYGDNNDFSSLSEEQITEKCEDLKLDVNTSQSLIYFIHYIKKENYVIIGNGNKYVRALAKVIGDYEYDSTTPIRYNHFRKVEWIFKDENIPIEELYNRGLSQQSIYKIDENGLKKEFFVNQGQLVEPEAKKVKNYVLIIDEINRGNVSSIFGELITLIEPDKRAGEKEELEVTLPYSKEPFKVPHNVYIVGTMNTADRSIEALDTALRRRFSFKEMAPKPELIETEGNSGKTNGIVDGINLSSLLQTMNTRIEKLIDKDHKIGHSYFLKVNSKETLINCFENEVIPLLEEYFFGDYGKIGLVLGDSFITKDDTEVFEFAEFKGYDSDVSSDLKERSVYKIRPSKDWEFNSI